MHVSTKRLHNHSSVAGEVVGRLAMAVWAQRVDVFPVSPVVLCLAHLEGVLLVFLLMVIVIYVWSH